MQTRSHKRAFEAVADQEHPSGDDKKQPSKQAAPAAAAAKDERSALDLIKAALGSNGKPPVCHGSVQLAHPPAIFGEDQDGALFAVHLPLKDAGCSSDAVAGAALQPLLHACVPAVFGKGSKEVLDDSYRKALALPVDRFATSFSLGEHTIMPVVQELLMPDAPSIAARLHKLNVYGPGGFFKTHKDTPRSEDQFGSLVVCLPVPHEGGSLVVRHGGSEQVRTSWGCDEDVKNNIVRWTAFYSDCEHEVEPVTSGHRITLTYELTAPTAASGSGAAASTGATGSSSRRGAASSSKASKRQLSEAAVAGSPLFAALKAALQDASFLPEGGTLGIGCVHQYAIGSHTILKPKMLKGGDWLAYAAAAQLQLSPALKLVFDGSQDPGGFGYSDEELERQDAECLGIPFNKRYYLLNSPFEIPRRGSPCDPLWISDEGYKDALEGYGAKEAKGVQWLNEGGLRFVNKHSCVFFGNEGEEGLTYSAAAMLITVPPWSSRSSRS